MGQAHKRLTDDQVKGLIERYLRKEIDKRRGSREGSARVCEIASEERVEEFETQEAASIQLCPTGGI